MCGLVGSNNSTKPVNYTIESTCGVVGDTVQVKIVRRTKKEFV